MKKKIFATAMVVMLGISSLMGCGKKEEAPESTAAPRYESYNVDDYVTLGEYKGLEVEYSGKFKVTDEEVDAKIKATLNSKSTYEEIKDRDTVAKGDIANIDYVGRVNDVAFQGGTDTGYDLEIGSGTFIDGFEEQLVGVKVGEETNINVTFPSTYPPNPELAGKEAVFTVKVNSIKKKVTPELTDEFVAENSESKTVAEYKEQLKKTLQEERDKEVLDYKLYYAYAKAVENAKVESVPQSLLDYYVDDYKAQVQKEAESSSVELTAFLKSNYGMTEEDFEKQLVEFMTEVVKERLVIEAIAKAEKLELSDAEFNEECKEYAKANGHETVDKLLSVYEEADLREYFNMIRVRDFIGESATIIEKTASEEATSEETSK